MPQTYFRYILKNAGAKPPSSSCPRLVLHHSRSCHSDISVNTDSMSTKSGDATADRKAYFVVRDEVVAQWGALGTAWGVNRTMAQIHALLMVSPSPLSTDDVMAELQISRGNAHTNLRELVGWGLIRSVFRKGERREF